jgi:prevent-host-death family protein
MVTSGEGLVRTVSVREARQRLRMLLDEARDGEEVIIVRRGRPVARLGPPTHVARRLPDLAGFRASIRVRGAPLSVEVIRARREARS